MLNYNQLCCKCKAPILAVIISSAPNVCANQYQKSYPVTGSTAQALINNMGDNTHVPKGAFGYTKLETQIGWVSFINTDGLCEIESVEFDYDITIYMPEWQDKHTAKQCLQDSWDTVWADIQLHEERHRDLFRLLDRQQIEQQLGAIAPQASCAILKKTINQQLATILEDNEQLHIDFHNTNTPPTLWDC